MQTNVTAQPLLLEKTDDGCLLVVVTVQWWAGRGREGKERGWRWDSGHAIFSMLWWRNRHCCARVCVGEKKGVKNLCVCVKERDRFLQWEDRCENSTVCVCVCLYSLCVCVCERVCTCLCKLMRERRGGGKGGGCKCWSLMVKVHWPAQLRSFRAPPPSRHLTTTLTFLRRGGARLRVSDFECRVEIPRFRTLTRNRKSEHPRTGALWTLPMVASSLNSPDSGGVGDWLFFFFFFVGDFLKKSGKWFSKKRKVKKKKRNSAEKRKIDIPDCWQSQLSLVFSFEFLLWQHFVLLTDNFLFCEIKR